MIKSFGFFHAVALLGVLGTGCGTDKTSASSSGESPAAAAFLADGRPAIPVLDQRNSAEQTARASVAQVCKLMKIDRLVRLLLRLRPGPGVASHHPQIFILDRQPLQIGFRFRVGQIEELAEREAAMAFRLLPFDPEPIDPRRFVGGEEERVADPRGRGEVRKNAGLGLPTAAQPDAREWGCDVRHGRPTGSVGSGSGRRTNACSPPRLSVILGS